MNGRTGGKPSAGPAEKRTVEKRQVLPLDFDPASDMVHFADGRLPVGAGPGNRNSDALAEDLKEPVEAANASEVRRQALEQEPTWGAFGGEIRIGDRRYQVG